MSRAVRRQQAAAPKERSQPKTSLGSRTSRDTRGAKPPSAQKRRFRLKQPGWFDEIFSELKKVTWPTREETAYLTSVVIIVALVAGTMLGLVDVFFSWLIDNLLVK
jgi:preprotein translocase subunit SecE